VGARFSVPTQTYSGTHAVSFTMGIVSLQGVERPGRGVDYVPSSCAEIKERLEVYYGHSWPVIVWNLALTLTLKAKYSATAISFTLISSHSTDKVHSNVCCGSQNQNRFLL